MILVFFNYIGSIFTDNPSLCDTMHKISYVTNITVCFLLAFILLSFKPLKHSKSKKYRRACLALAVATFLVGLGNALIYFDQNLDIAVDLFSFPVVLTCFIQAWMFTFILTLLFREKYVTKKNMLIHLTPFLCFLFIYLLSLIWWDNVKVFGFAEWKQHLNNIPLLIRSFSVIFYFIQLGIFTYIFLRERDLYLNEYGNQFDTQKPPELRWVTNCFFSALFIGVLAFTSCIFPSRFYDISLTFAITVFYTAVVVYYANFHYTYGTLYVSNETKNSADYKQTSATSEQVISPGIRSSARNQKLFDLAEQQMREEQLYLDASFNRVELARLLGTNEKYLSAALADLTGMTIQAYITSWRIKHAQSELMDDTDMRSMEEIALASGFSSLRSFNRLFRSVTGKTPSEFRKSC